MPKVLLISGSPRKGNTIAILNLLYNSIDCDKELIDLKKKDIKHCTGCLSCHYKPSCIIKDDMGEILSKMIEADILVIGTPNYFDNVSGLMKDFIDRTHPLYKVGLLKEKSVILIMVGGGGTEGTKRFLNETMHGFIKYHKLNLINSYAFEALEYNDLENNTDFKSQVLEILEYIR